MASIYETVGLTLKVTGLERLKAAMQLLGEPEYHRGAIKDFMITYLLPAGQAYATMITHKDTGHLADAHAWRYDSHAMRGEIYISPRVAWAYKAGNKVYWPAKYGVFEEKRGGSHAFYGRTYEEMLKRYLPNGMKYLVQYYNRTLP